MARFLIVYGTTHGHTAKVADAVAHTLRTAAHHVVTVATPDGLEPAPEPFDAVIVAASVVGGRFQKNVRRWVHAHAQALNARPSAFIQVCLGVLQRDAAVQAEVQAIRLRFLGEAHWRPLETRVIAGGLPYTQYNWITRWVMRRIAARAGGGTDTSRDYDYTDWTALRAFTVEFAARVVTNAVPMLAASA
jgi:menaquinone-dependent protoporphyrinogen oxidase